MTSIKHACAMAAIWIGASLACQAQQVIRQQLRTVDQAASGLADKIIGVVGQDISTGAEYRIVVFRFATDRQAGGFATGFSVETPRILQGSIIHELITRANGRYLCDSEEQIVDRLETTKKNFNISQTSQATAFMEDHGIDAVVVGQILHETPFEVDWDDRGNQRLRTKHSKVRATVFLRSSKDSSAPSVKVRQVVDRLIPGEEQYQRAQIDRVGRSGKYVVTVECDGDVLPYDQSGQLMVQQKYFGKPFAIRLQHTGESGPWLNHDPSVSRKRMTKAVVYVDGVSNYLRHGVRYTGSPDKATGRILAPPNHSVVMGAGKRFSARTWQPGEITYWDVRLEGFEKDNQLFDRFTFANDEESVGRESGTDDQIGLISIFFYEQKLSGDVHVDDYISERRDRLTELNRRLHPDWATAAGTAAGEPFRGQVTRGKMSVHRQPAEVWRIKYDYIPNVPEMAADEYITDAQRKDVRLKVGEVAYFHQPGRRSMAQETLGSINDEIKEVSAQLGQRRGRRPRIFNRRR